MFLILMFLVLKLFKGEIQTTLNIILLTLFIVFAILYKNVIIGYRNMSQIAKINLYQSKPLDLGIEIDNLKKRLINRNLTVYSSNDKYEIYYESMKSKNIPLEIIILINDNAIDYYDKTIHDEINKLEDEISKKHKYREMIILAFKKYNVMSKEDLNNIGEVVCYSISKKKYVQINVGLSAKDKKAFFLYSDKYYPNHTYKKSVDKIKEIIR